MEHWDNFEFGPLKVFSTAGRLVECGQIVGFGQAEFAVLLRLMACQGGVVSKSVLSHGISDTMLRLSICRLRKFLKKHFGVAIIIKTVRQYGYRLSLEESLLFHMKALSDRGHFRGYLRVFQQDRIVSH